MSLSTLIFTTTLHVLYYSYHFTGGYFYIFTDLVSCVLLFELHTSNAKTHGFLYNIRVQKSYSVIGQIQADE